MAALAAGSLLVGGAGTMQSTHCESMKKSNVVDPKTYPSMSMSEDDDDDNASNPKNMKGTFQIQATSAMKSPKDPMTVYQQIAIKRQKEEDADKASKHGPPPSSSKATRATSPTPAEDKAARMVGDQYLTEMSAEELKIEEAARKAKQHSGGLKIFSGNGNMSLALDIAKHLGINLGKATVGRFADGEANVVIHENIRGKDVYIIQPTCPPVNDNIMELLLMVSTLRRASARRITVVIPYYGYARQDRKMQVSSMLSMFVNDVFLPDLTGSLEQM
jgi:hypothetical protein